MSRRSTARVFAAGGVAASVVAGVWKALDDGPVTSQRWRRRNYRDRDVTLLLGPAIAAGALAGLVAAGPGGRRSALLVVGSAAAVGGYDDLYGDAHARGLGGHARALREGRVTTGMVKLVTLVAASALGSASEHRNWIDTSIGTVLVAGAANLVNLFDLRPGRAAKLSVVAAIALAAGGDSRARPVAAVAAGAALAALPADLGERAMLGDCGAGTLGAVLGWSAGLGGGRRRRCLLAAAVVALTAASERVSFSAVIDGNSTLRRLDGLGRQPQ